MRRQITFCGNSIIKIITFTPRHPRVNCDPGTHDLPPRLRLALLPISTLTRGHEVDKLGIYKPNVRRQGTSLKSATWNPEYPGQSIKLCPVCKKFVIYRSSDLFCPLTKGCRLLCCPQGDKSSIRQMVPVISRSAISFNVVGPAEEVTWET